MRRLGFIFFALFTAPVFAKTNTEGCRNVAAGTLRPESTMLDLQELIPAGCFIYSLSCPGVLDMRSATPRTVVEPWRLDPSGAMAMVVVFPLWPDPSRPPRFELSSVLSSEVDPEAVEGAVLDAPDLEFKVKAVQGRIYTVVYRVWDSSGGSTTHQQDIVVEEDPHTDRVRVTWDSREGIIIGRGPIPMPSETAPEIRPWGAAPE